MSSSCLAIALLVLAFSHWTSAARNWMRPQPSHDLPVLDLIEPKDKRYDPTPGDLNPKLLRERLGKDFDKHFMSETRPIDSLLHPNGSVDMSFKRTRKGRLVPSSKMPKEIRHLRLHSLKLPDGSRFRMKVSKKMRRRFKQLLWSYTYCPVAHRWKDLGLRFWPRWVKEGSCLTLGSCSFPSGMSCKPHRFARKTLLRWHCQDWARRRHCKWIPVNIPIVLECSCGC